MTTRTPLSLRRLSPLQAGLSIVTLFMLFAVIALGLVTFSTADTARSAFEAGYVLTDLASLQRGVYRLVITTERVVRQGEGGSGVLKAQSGQFLQDLERAVAKFSDNQQITQSLFRMENILAEYQLVCSALTDPDRPDAAGISEERLVSIVVRLEREAEDLYDHEEARFFDHIRSVLSHQRTSQIMLLVTCVLLLFFSVTLVLSLRRSVSHEFERAYTMLEALYGADEELHRHLSTEAVFQALVDVVVEIFGAAKSALMLCHPEGRQLTCVAQRGFERALARGTTLSIDEGLVGVAARTGQPTIVEDSLRDDRVLKRIVIPENVRAMLHMPVSMAGRVYGVLSVCYVQPRSFDNDDVRLVRALTHRAASAIENARLYEQVEEAATAEERQRLARELHDAVTQTLFSASLIAEVLPRIWERSPEQGRERLAELRELTRGALAEMRTLLLELRPAALIDAELGDLLQQLAEASTGRARLPVHVERRGKMGCEVPPDVKVALYRIAQEALNNVIKHADASQADVLLLCDTDHLELSISDDGAGFDPGLVTPEHLGLGIMRDRARAIGTNLGIESSPGQGTTIRVRWPAA